RCVGGRSQGNDLETVPASALQRSGRETAAEAAALGGFVHLGVREGDAALTPVVSGQADQASAEPEFVATRLGYVDDLRLGHGSLGRLELVGPTEVLDQLARRIRDARVAVIGEPPAVGSREPPRVPLVQVREDLARTAVEGAVLRLQDRDAVGTGRAAQAV